MKQDKKPSYIFSSGDLSPFDSVKVITQESSGITEAIDEAQTKPGEEAQTESKTVEATEDKPDLFGRKDKVYSDVVETVKDPPESVKKDSEVEESETVKDSVVKKDQEEDNVNLYYYMAEQLKKDGELPEDFELSQEVKPQDIYNTYKESLRGDVEADITNQVLLHLKNQGINDRDLQYAKLIRSGVDINTLNLSSKYEQLSSVEIEGADLTSKQKLIREMYSDKGMDEDAISMLVDSADIDDKTDEFAKRAKEYFKTKSEQILEQETLTAQQRQEAENKLREQRLKHINNIWDSGKLLDEDIPNVKDFKKSVYERTLTENINGQSYNLSEFEKFSHQLDVDPEVRLWAFKKFKYRGEDATKLKEEVKAEVEDNFFSGYKQEYEKRKTNPLKSTLKRKLEENSKKGITIFEDGMFKKV